MNGFVLELQGPMMSFGDTGFGQLRDAGDAPSRSTVIGIIAAAMGVERGAAMLVLLHRELRVHVAAALEGRRLVDYQTVMVDGYEPEDPVLLRRGGAAGANPVLTWRSYHVDAHFVALVTSRDAGLLEQCMLALHSPHYTAYIGRRSCPPATPLLPREMNGGTVGAALGAAIADARARRASARIRRRRPVAGAFHAWLDGDPAMIAAEADRVDLVWSTRRDLLIALPRVYVNRPVVHARYMPADNAHTTPNTMEDYFDAAP